MTPVHREPFDAQALRRFARRGRFPLRSPCPNGCRFCYERNMSRMVPASRLARMPVLTPEAFDYVLEQAAAADVSLDPGSSRLTLPDGSVMFFSFSDFFSQGLTTEQIDRLLTHNEHRLPVPYLYTNGQMLEPGMARRLSELHPRSFHLYLSVFTFDDGIKVRLVPKWPGSAHLLEILPHLPSAVVYLTHFSFEQTLADLRTIDSHAHPAEPPVAVLSRLHYNRLHPPVIRELAERGLPEVPRVLQHLASGREPLGRIGKIVLQFPSTGYAWAYRDFLAEKLSQLRPGEGDVVLGSRAASPVLRRLLAGSGAEVHSVADPLGGSTDFATTVTTPELVARAHALLGGRARLGRVVVPSSMWPFDGRCLAGGTADDLRDALPGVDVAVVEIPSELISSCLTLEQALDFFDSGGSAMMEEVA